MALRRVAKDWAPSMGLIKQPWKILWSLTLATSSEGNVMFKLFTLMAFMFFSVFATAQEKVIRVSVVTTDPNASYSLTMLKLALERIETKYRIKEVTEDFTQTRVNEEVRTGGLDLAWIASDSELESTLLPIRIPLFKGLLGYRIFIINADNQAKFDRIQTLEQLKQQITMGQGKTWADTKILETNGFKVVKATKYPGLFHMVDGGRFDAFPRGVHEPFGEIRERPALNLAVEQNLMIAYKMPYYFFVGPDNHELANDVERGLNLAIADGSFDKAFFSAPQVTDVIEKANMKNRRIFFIDNALLSPETPLDRSELWFDPRNLE
jgi:hypothetical protein